MWKYLRPSDKICMGLAGLTDEMFARKTHGSHKSNGDLNINQNMTANCF